MNYMILRVGLLQCVQFNLRCLSLSCTTLSRKDQCVKHGLWLAVWIMIDQVSFDEKTDEKLKS